MKTLYKLIPVFIALVLGSLARPAAADRIVVSSDDRTFSGTILAETPGLAQYAGDGAIFESNVMDWLGGPNGRFLRYGDVPPGFIYTTMVGTHQVVQSSDPAELAHLYQYNGLIVGLFVGQPISSSFLKSYVLSGGNVYLYGGTNYHVDAAGEAARWADFLDLIGVQFASTYRSTPGYINVSEFASQEPFGPFLFGGVRYLDNLDDQPLTYLDPSAKRGTQIFGDGYFAAAEIVPELATWQLSSTGLILFAVAFRFRSATARV